jgi:hypothetical protein
MNSLGTGREKRGRRGDRTEGVGTGGKDNRQRWEANDSMGRALHPGQAGVRKGV